MSIARRTVFTDAFNPEASLPYELRIKDFELAMQDVYDFFHDVNSGLVHRGLGRLDDTLRPAMLSGLLSDMLTASIAKHARALATNGYFNGHPDLVLKGQHANDAVKAGEHGSRSRPPGNAEAPWIHMEPATSGCVCLSIA